MIHKTLWLTSKSGNQLKTWQQLFEDSGIKFNHEVEIIENCLEQELDDLLKSIIEVDQICFASSMVGSSIEIGSSVQAITRLIAMLDVANIEGKIFRSAGYLLSSLQSGYKMGDIENYKNVFNYNMVYELEDGVWHRIMWDAEHNRFAYFPLK
jgi:hypothetical protein